MKLMTNGRKLLLAGVALTACLGFTFNAQAQTCTISNWLGAPTGLSDSDAGTQDTAASTNRRYGGPCGLRVPVDGAVHEVVDDSPASETTYIARFYVFLDAAGSNSVQLFGADNGTADQIQVWYNEPSAGDLTLRVFDNGGTPTDLVQGSVGAGWHSVEFGWESNASADVFLSVDGAGDITDTLATDTLSIANATLGNLNAASGGGAIDFDDFDSRRIERPGRLCRGLTNDTRTALALEDVTNIFNELASNGNSAAPGQPDYNEDGVVDLGDVTAVFGRIASANDDCSVNS